MTCGMVRASSVPRLSDRARANSTSACAASNDDGFQKNGDPPVRLLRLRLLCSSSVGRSAFGGGDRCCIQKISRCGRGGVKVVCLPLSARGGDRASTPERVS